MMMNNLSRLCFLGLVVIGGCNFHRSARIPEVALIKSLTSVIQLQPVPTVLYLNDVVADVRKVDSLSSSSGYRVSWLPGADTALLVADSSAPAMGALHIWMGGYAYTAPLRKSRKSWQTFSFADPEQRRVSMAVKGSFNGWNPKAGLMEWKQGSWTYSCWLGPGNHQYVLVADGGHEFRDPSNKDSISNGMGGWNSLRRTGSAGTAPYIATKAFTGTQVRLSMTAGAGILALWENHELPWDSAQGFVTFEIPKQARKKERSHLRIWVYDQNRSGNDVLIPLERGKVLVDTAALKRSDLHATVIYNPMIDRFFNGNPSNDRPLNRPDVHPRVDFHGGDVAGITRKIRDGYFSGLGISTLWISPVILNPEGPYGQWPKPATKFSAYHGYWPISSTRTDPRFCTPEELKELISVAHSHGINVLLDYVAHHVHQEHHLFREHPEWFSSLLLPDGTKNTERWDEYRLSTWFDDFLPTFNFSNPEVVARLSDSAVWWLEQFPADGFRHDATKHIPEAFWRALTRKLKQRISETDSGRALFQIGETYGSPELISGYLGSGMLDAQFDFNLYDAAVAAFSKPFGMKHLEEVLRESMEWYGSHHLMGNITGNQDRPRFVSLADGSIPESGSTKQAGWDRTIVNSNEASFHQLQALFAFMCAVPGIPVMYYGDEVGMPGANDPDSRRMMRFDSLNSMQLAQRDMFARLARMRRNHLALSYGDVRIISADQESLLLERNYFGKKIVCVFYSGKTPRTFSLSAAPSHSLCGNKVQRTGNEVRLTLAPNRFDYLY
jgi:glycosidase